MDVPISIISVTDGVMGMGFGGVLLDQEDAGVVIIGRVDHPMAAQCLLSSTR